MVGYDEAGRPAYGAGPGVGMVFVKAYFPSVRQVLRIATAYFTLRGYKLGRDFVRAPAQLHVLVGRSEEHHAYEAVVDEIIAELGQCQTDLMTAVGDLLERMRTGRFFIREARSMQVPFHCKIYLIDDQVAWHGSCNYTYRGLKISAEQASASHAPAQVRDWIRWYDQVAAEARDLLRELEEKLEAWYQLAMPFAAYLKMLLLLDHLPELPARTGAYPPAFYQRGVIARALRQEREFGGALIVAATGLGKTVIGAEIAARLQASGAIRRTILVAPTGVEPDWQQQLDGRDVTYKFFTSQVLFRDKSDKQHHRTFKLDQELQQADRHTLLLIDEAHFYRNQLLIDESAQRSSRVYERLHPLVAAGARVVLLTATVYGTSLQNLNSLLYLLPPLPDAASGHLNPWRITTAARFVSLPIVTVLGLPHVLRLARERGDVDEHGRTFIQFAHERRYLPQFLRLRTVSYPLLLQPALEQAVEARCFDQQFKVRQPFFDDATLQTRQGLTDAVYNATIRGWLSSPAAVRRSIEQNLASGRASAGLGRRGRENARSPREPRAFKQPMILAADERQRHLEPILAALNHISPAEDPKYQQLASIMQQHCVRQNGKVLVFVNRLSTAVYLQAALQQEFAGTLRIGCTVEAVRGVVRLLASEQRREILIGFSPKSHRQATRDQYEVLICTDADGVGVSLQDCATVVNYDPPGGADVLFQRVGRVLRMTTDPEREVHVYTFTPGILTETGNQGRAEQTIRQLFERITQRHDKSQGIMGSAVYAAAAHTDIPLAGDMTATDFLLQDNTLAEVGGLGARSFLTHNAALERHRRQAAELPGYLLSARFYREARPRVVVLVRQGAAHYLICYDEKQQQLEVWPDLQLLDWVGCGDTEPKAPVPAAHIEHTANEAVQRWCHEQRADLREVSKLSVVYLLPTHQRSSSAKRLLNSLKKNDADRK